MGLVEIAHNFGAKTIFTLHDYWLLCARGQFIDRNMNICDNQTYTKCIKCLQEKYKINGNKRTEDNCLKLLKDRERIISKIFQRIDIFIAPSKFLRNKFIEYGLPKKKIVYRDYGFKTDLFSKVHSSKDRKDRVKNKIVFGYCGTAIPSKGLEVLIDSIKYLNHSKKEFEIRIHASEHSRFKEYYQKLLTKSQKYDQIRFLGKYSNLDVAHIYNTFDVLIVPSLWYENSPLVIHEAFQAKIPAITSNRGGMAELIEDGKNGLLFNQGSPEDLAQKMHIFLDNPELIVKYGKNHPSVHSIESDASFMLDLFENLSYTDNQKIKGPWRITFDTNPDDCNLSCIMCEGFSNFNSSKSKSNFHRRMPFESVEKVVLNALPFGLKEIIPSTMGEPLLYKDFEKFIEICRDTGVKLNLTTNGTFPKKKPSEWAEIIAPVTNDVKISWNGAIPKTQESIMLGSHFDKRVQSVKEFINVRDEVFETTGHYCRISFQMTFMKRNYQEIPEIIRLAHSLGVDRIKGHHLWILYPEMENESLKQSSEYIDEWNKTVDIAFQTVDQLYKESGRKLLLDNFYKLDSNQNIDIPQSWECPFLIQEAWIAWDGTFNICCAPDEERKTLGSWGNIKNDDFMTLWKNQKLIDFQKHYKKNPLCQKCVMRKPKT